MSELKRVEKKVFLPLYHFFLFLERLAYRDHNKKNSHKLPSMESTSGDQREREGVQGRLFPSLESESEVVSDSL